LEEARAGIAAVAVRFWGRVGEVAGDRRDRFGADVASGGGMKFAKGLF
jgi:hypothetical protein